MTEKILLTVDWDYFVPEDLMLDMSHKESLFFITDLWLVRATGLLARDRDYTEMIKTNNQEIDFWNKLKKRFIINKDTPVIITESHASAYYIAEELNIRKVYNFDAHCDLGYGGWKGLKKGELDCGSWLGKLLIEERINHATVIYSPETHETCEIAEDNQFFEIASTFEDQIRFTSVEELLQEPTEEVACVHICRSGAWTPPWLDYKFRKFYKKLTKHPDIHNLVDRKWGKKEKDTIAKNAQAEKSFISDFKSQVQ